MWICKCVVHHLNKKKLPKRPHETEPRPWLGISWLDTSYPKSPLYRCIWLTQFWTGHMPRVGFSDSSVGKESAYNEGDTVSIPGWWRSVGEEIGYPLQYSWASLVAQLVKNPPAMQETWVRSLDWEDPRKKGTATQSSILAWRIPWTVYIVHGVVKSQTWLSDFHFHSQSWLTLLVNLALRPNSNTDTQANAYTSINLLKDN